MPPRFVTVRFVAGKYGPRNNFHWYIPHDKGPFKCCRMSWLRNFSFNVPSPGFFSSPVPTKLTKGDIELVGCPRKHLCQVAKLHGGSLRSKPANMHVRGFWNWPIFVTILEPQKKLKNKGAIIFYVCKGGDQKKLATGNHRQTPPPLPVKNDNSLTLGCPKNRTFFCIKLFFCPIVL